MLLLSASISMGKYERLLRCARTEGDEGGGGDKEREGQGGGRGYAGV